jgi:hypothetical protein
MGMFHWELRPCLRKVPAFMAIILGRCRCPIMVSRRFQVRRAFADCPVGFEYPQSYDAPQQHYQHTTSYANQSPHTYATEPIDPQYYQSHYNHPIQGSYTSSFGSASVPSNPTRALSQESSYPYPPPGPNNYAWSQPTPVRSLSSGDPEEIAHNFPAVYRTNTYPSFERRMTGDTSQQHTPAGAGILPITMEGQLDQIPAHIHEPSSYQPLHMQGHEWSHPGSVGVYSSTWYPPPQGASEVRHDEEQPPMLPSQLYHPRSGSFEAG